MKGSKIRDNFNSKKKKHGKGSSMNLDAWDQSDLEDADEKVLEKRLHQLKMQLEMDQDGEREKRLPIKYRKKYSEEQSSDSDSTDSSTSLSSASSASVPKYKSKRSSSFSDDDRRKRYSRSRSPTTKKKSAKGYKGTRNRVDRECNINPKADKRIVFRKKTSPASEKYSRKKSPLLDRREIYSRVDTGRWHEKAKEFTKERNKREVEHDKPRSRSRTERNRSISLVRELPRVSSRAKDDRTQKKTAGRGPIATASRRKESPEQSRTRVSHETARRTTLVTRKLSPKDERTGRHDERKLELKVTRRNDNRTSDTRDVNLRVTRDLRDRKEPITKLPEKARDRELVGGKTHRETLERGSVDRDRSRVNDDRFKDRDKRQQDRVVEPERNLRNVSRDSQTDDKFRRNERAVEVSNRGGGVFDRMRNRYNDRRNAENSQRLNRERERVVDKEMPKPRLVDMNGAAEKMLRERRPLVSQIRIRSPLHRERKEPERTVLEKRSHSPVRFSSPSNVRKARELENRVILGKRKSQENDKLQWNVKRTPNDVRSRSRSSERRRRRSSQEEWRVIDMTSPVLDDEFSDDNIGSFDNNMQNKLRRQVANKVLHAVKSDELYDSDPSRHKPILTDELSDISDEDFGDINSNNNSIRTKKDLLPRNDRPLKSDQISRNYDQRPLNDCNNVANRIADVVETKKTTTNYVEDLIGDQKLPTAGGQRTDDDLDSEEDTVSRVSDALGVDWTDLVEETKRRAPSSLDASYSIRRRWKAINILARIGISQKYAGEELYSEMEKDIVALGKDDVAGESRTEDKDEKLWHKVASLHVSLKDRTLKRRTLFEPYKTAISARKDIMLRRRLCGLPVKNLQTQQIIGICHWLV